MTTVHPRADTRIFLKYCKTYARDLGECSLIVADGKGAAHDGSVNIYDIGKSKSPLLRVIFGSQRALKQALAIKCDIYHLHDPELVFVGLLLRAFKKTVIMDIHEDAPAQMKDKHYLNPFLRVLLSLSLSLLEKISFPFFSGLVGATPHIKVLYQKYNKNVIGIYNYVLLSELTNDRRKRVEELPNKVCFVGGIEEKRGILNLVDALPYVNGGVELILGGNFPDKDFKVVLEKSKGWEFVDFRGYLSREDMNQVFKECLIGVVPFLPAENHINSLPNKIFEYMGAGLPVLGSNFVYWEKLIDDNGVGSCVDTCDSLLIAETMNLMLKDRAGLKKMGDTGANLVREKYNWDSQMDSLKAFYRHVIKL
jgi:glycosyltransferase involved in cell wall biosynthesis